ncbi:MAG: rod shape-determining protein MreC [Bacteroidetes bacterium]|nr:rod shape-determining protein MreC [Bacteroidota bacterium]MBS1775604.1 rod shape-determining protein MreC [Bacteroidota bacterium]
MRNFILFVRRFFNLILFLTLEIICFVLIARTNTLQGNALLSSANTIAGIVYQKREDVVYYFGLKRMNDSLINENIRLRIALAQTQGVDTLKDSSVQRKITLDNDTTHIVRFANYVYRNARVVNNSVTSENNYITINRGSNQGIKRHMAVISSTGVVGEVINVSNNFASILSVLNVKRKLSARLKDGTMGSVMWDDGKPDVLILEDIPKELKVYRGDSVFTTSYSFFPPGILIGTVDRMRINKKNNIQVLYLKSATNFRNLQYVYVIENTLLDERRELQDSTKKAK